MALNEVVKQLKNEVKTFDLNNKKITKRLSDEVFNLACAIETIFFLQEDSLEELTLLGIKKDTTIPINIRRRAKEILCKKKK